MKVYLKSQIPSTILHIASAALSLKGRQNSLVRADIIPFVTKANTAFSGGSWGSSIKPTTAAWTPCVSKREAN